VKSGRIGLLTTALLAAAGVAHAAQPEDGGLGLQPAATDMMRQVTQFHDVLLVIITAISVFVLALLLWVIVRYNKRANPVPQKFTHNVPLEIAWTAIPVLILVFIAFLSFPLLFKEERIPTADFTIKATGNTWYWGYEYPDYGVSIAASNLLPEDEAKAQGRPYLLATDVPIYVPVGATVKMQITSNDVIHAWTIPAFAIKEDAIPGKLNEGWFKVEKPGIYYGQCSELCGTRHAFMPIEVRAVSQEEFNRWVIEQGGEIKTADAAPVDAPDAANAPAAPAEPAPPAQSGQQ
jgi:cytochrome c oxidase subunit 2